MLPLEKIKWLFLVITLFVSANFAVAQEKDSFDEDSPEVTARVARISFIRGEVQVKRVGENDWESVSLNLPLVEGDEIATSNNARIEIQFDSQNFLRLAENSFLKITTLRDEGIAVSLNEGLLSLRVFSFEKDKGYFEIDAPQTTVSVQNAGLFRIDTRETEQIKVAATEGGQARIYSDNSGFTLRNGRNATIFLSQDRLGEWETADAAKYSDEWDNWIAERDNKLAKLLKDSYYDKYYDRDIYGAEDLNDYGSWSHSNDYGWIWRPYQTSISVYSNWSPYRFGHWTWVNPFGWVWVNDEPWGWATYHHGRWVNDGYGWFWTPYPQYRPKRSWWKAALVAIFNINTDICWYPLSYRDRYYDYNRQYRRNDRNRDFNNRRDNDWNNRSRDFRNLPENSVIGMRSADFGRRRGETRPIPSQNVRQVLQNRPNEIAQLPKFEGRRREDFRRNTDFRRSDQVEQIRTGVTERRAGVELDKQLQNERFRNNRQRGERNRPTENNNPQNGIQNNGAGNNERPERRNRDTENRNQNPISIPQNPDTNWRNTSRERNSENQPRRNDEQTPVNVPQPTNSGENNQPNRNRERNSEENNQRSRNRGNNPVENPTPPQPENNSEENNRRSRNRERETENNNQNNGRRENPTENRPIFTPRNNEENRRSAPPPRSEEPQPRPQPQREERREQPRQEQPRPEPRREQPKVEQRREEPKVEQRRESPRQEQPRQEQPRPKEQPREEKRSAPPPPKGDKKPNEPIID